MSKLTSEQKIQWRTICDCIADLERRYNQQTEASKLGEYAQRLRLAIATEYAKLEALTTFETHT